MRVLSRGASPRGKTCWASSGSSVMSSDAFPTAKDLDARRKRMPSKSLYWHTFGSFTEALRAAGFDVPVGEERLERAIVQGVEIARRLGRLPRFADWREARLADPTLLTEWQVYRMLEAGPGAWPTLQYLVRERLLTEGVTVERGRHA